MREWGFFPMGDVVKSLLQVLRPTCAKNRTSLPDVPGFQGLVVGVEVSVDCLHGGDGGQRDRKHTASRCRGNRASSPPRAKAILEPLGLLDGFPGEKAILDGRGIIAAPA